MNIYIYIFVIYYIYMILYIYISWICIEHAWSIWNIPMTSLRAPTARETEALLTRPAMETPRSG